eukprot:5643905-Karenia_brevis.AAC.1
MARRLTSSTTYTRIFVKDGKFSDVAYNSEWDRLGVPPDGDAAYMQAIDRLVKNYLYTVIPDSISRKIKILDEKIWEENRTTITGRRMLL